MIFALLCYCDASLKEEGVPRSCRLSDVREDSERVCRPIVDRQTARQDERLNAIERLADRLEQSPPAEH